MLKIGRSGQDVVAILDKKLFIDFLKLSEGKWHGGIILDTF